jgi:putative heme iron utilization protein
MSPEQQSAIRSLLSTQETAALATLHKGDPAASMVPYALLPQGRGFVIHVSSLSTHTADMLAHPAVALLVTAPPGSSETPQALPRATVTGEARQCAAGSAEQAEARAAYLARFPHAEYMFAFTDFSLFVVQPRFVRFVGGFGNALGINAGQFAALMSAAA